MGRRMLLAQRMSGSPPSRLDIENLFKNTSTRSDVTVREVSNDWEKALSVDMLSARASQARIGTAPII